MSSRLAVFARRRLSRPPTAWVDARGRPASGRVGAARLRRPRPPPAPRATPGSRLRLGRQLPAATSVARGRARRSPGQPSRAGLFLSAAPISPGRGRHFCRRLFPPDPLPRPSRAPELPLRRTRFSGRGRPPEAPGRKSRRLKCRRPSPLSNGLFGVGPAASGAPLSPQKRAVSPSREASRADGEKPSNSTPFLGIGCRPPTAPQHFQPAARPPRPTPPIPGRSHESVVAAAKHRRALQGRLKEPGRCCFARRRLPVALCSSPGSQTPTPRRALRAAAV